MSGWQYEVEWVAAMRGGVILTKDLVRLGLTQRQSQQATAGLHRLRRGAYALDLPDDVTARHHLRALAVILVHRTAVALSHTSAAAFYGLPVVDEQLDTIHLTASGEGLRAGSRNGIYSHRGPLRPGDLSSIDSCPVTSPTRTVIDCGRSLPLVESVSIADAALHQGLVDLPGLRRRLIDLGNLVGVPATRRMIYMTDPNAESPGETRVRLILAMAGFHVASQVEIVNRSGDFLGRVDFKLKGLPVVVEFDGRAKYSEGRSVEAELWQEKKRHDAIENAGYKVVRVTWNLFARPAEIIRLVEEASAVVRARGAA